MGEKTIKMVIVRWARDWSGLCDLTIRSEMGKTYVYQGVGEPAVWAIKRLINVRAYGKAWTALRRIEGLRMKGE